MISRLAAILRGIGVQNMFPASKVKSFMGMQPL